MAKRSKGSRRRSAEGDWAQIGPFVGHGISVVIAMMLFGALGWWIDGRFGTLPLFLVIGIFVGAAAAFYTSYQQIIVEPGRKRASEEARREQEKDGGAGPSDPGNGRS